jgi:ankyrin repeat protein
VAGRPGNKDGNGWTPLILAVSHDRLDVARLLVALGADPDTQDASISSWPSWAPSASRLVQSKRGFPLLCLMSADVR